MRNDLQCHVYPARDFENKGEGMSQIRAYVSHPIRGIKGKDATREDMEANNRRAIAFARILRERFPTVEFYVPAEHDEFVLNAYEQGSLTEEEILAADCAIVRKCHFLLALIMDEHISRGMIKEIVEATKHHMPAFIVAENSDLSVIDIFLDAQMRG